MLTPSYSYKHHNIWCLVSDFLTHWPFHQTLLFAHHWCINAAVSCLAKSRYTCKSNHAGWTHGTREATSPTGTLHAIFWFCRVTWWTCKKQNLKKENIVQTFITLYQDSTKFLANYGLNKEISMFFIFYFKKIQALLLVYYRYTVIFHCYLIQDKKQKKPSPEVMFTGCLTAWMRPVFYLWVPVVRWVLAALYPDLLQRLWVPFDLLKKIKDATHKAAQLCFQTFFFLLMKYWHCE